MTDRSDRWIRREALLALGGASPSDCLRLTASDESATAVESGATDDGGRRWTLDLGDETPGPQAAASGHLFVAASGTTYAFA